MKPGKQQKINFGTKTIKIQDADTIGEKFRDTWYPNRSVDAPDKVYKDGKRI